MRKKEILYFCGALIAGAVAVTAFHAIRPPQPSEAQLGSGAYWEARVNTVGSAAAYKELSRALEAKDPNTGHKVAHLFGGALYRAAGLSGIDTCDDQFIYGCFHQFTGEAIAQEGIGAVGGLGELCGTNVQCVHGVGHGILAHFGYDTAAVQQAVKACSALPAHDPFSGCESGVFMEYALRSMLEAPPRILLAGADSWSPCDAVKPGAAPTCYYWQPQTWKASWQASSTPAALLSRMGTLCATLEEPGRPFCFAGIGAAAISIAEYNPDSLAAWCDHASSHLADRTACRSSAGKALSGASERKSGGKVCMGLPAGEMHLCLQYIDNPSTPEVFVVSDPL